MRPIKEVSYALSLCQEKGHTGNPIVSKSCFVEAQMQLLGTETRRNRMREGCRSHYPASWHSQGKEAEKWQEEQPCSLRLGKSTEQEGTAVLIFNLVAISKFLLSCFSQMGRIAVLLCFMMECVLYPGFYAIIACRNKNDTKLSPLSLLSSPPPTPLVVPVRLYVHRYTHALCKGS